MKNYTILFLAVYGEGSKDMLNEPKLRDIMFEISSLTARPFFVYLSNLTLNSLTYLFQLLKYAINPFVSKP